MIAFQSLLAAAGFEQISLEHGEFRCLLVARKKRRD